MTQKLEDLLEESLETWGFARSGVIDELRNLSERELAFAPRARPAARPGSCGTSSSPGS